MPTIPSYNPAVAARTRAAQTLLSDEKLLSSYEAIGGLPEDLEHIASTGLRAEAANLAQSQAAAHGQGATEVATTAFHRLRGEHASVMAVVIAVKGSLVRNNAPAETIATLDRIIKNEAPVRTVSVTTKTGEKRTSTRKISSRETVRAEIRKDALALLEAKKIRAALARRKVSAARLKAMANDAESLSGLLGERAVSKGAAKAATLVEREAVKAQKDAWAAAYRLLAQLGRADPRVAALLKEAAWPRGKTGTR